MEIKGAMLYRNHIFCLVELAKVKEKIIWFRVPGNFSNGFNPDFANYIYLGAERTDLNISNHYFAYTFYEDDLKLPTVEEVFGNK